MSRNEVEDKTKKRREEEEGEKQREKKKKHTGHVFAALWPFVGDDKLYVSLFFPSLFTIRIFLRSFVRSCVRSRTIECLLRQVV